MLLWHWGGLRLAYKDLDSWDERLITRFIIIIGDIILWFVLVNMSPAYYFALFGLFIQVFRNLPIRYAAVAVLLLTAAVIFEQLTDAGESFTLTNPAVWSFFFIVLASMLMGIWISAIIEQSSRRRQLIDQLEAAQEELAAAERREGVLEERQRLAREIHDTLAQGFTSIVMHLEAAEQALPDDLDTLQKHLDQARRYSAQQPGRSAAGCSGFKARSAGTNNHCRMRLNGRLCAGRKNPASLSPQRSPVSRLPYIPILK